MSTSRERTGRVQAGIEDIRAGKMVILVDDEDRENEGDLTMAADKVTPEAINFMAKYGRGLICLTLTEEKADSLELPLQAARKSGGSPFGTAFTVTIEARHGVTTGISAKDRATTILTAVHENARAEDLIDARSRVSAARQARRCAAADRPDRRLGRPGAAGGTEPIGRDLRDHERRWLDGAYARPEEKFAQEHGLAILSIADLIEYRLEREVAGPQAGRGDHHPVVHGHRAGVARDGVRHARRADRISRAHAGRRGVGDAPVLVRVQTACFPGDVFGSEACDCGPQLRAAIAAIEREGRGVFLYVHPAGRQSLLGDVKSHVLHEEGPRVAGGEHKLRDFGLGAQVLSDLGVKNLRLLTNNPKKIVGLEGYGMCVVDRVPIEVGATQHNITYLRDKRDREGHLLATPALAPKPKKE